MARQRVRSLLDQVEPSNRQQTIEQLNRLVPWFRTIIDEELIAGWQKDSRGRLTLVMEPLADPHVAAEVVAFSWRKRTVPALILPYAPMLGHLMARYPDSGKEFLADLLGPVPPELTPPQVETVCRILLDMPDLGNWEHSALRILPRYREIAERMLLEDRQSDDLDKKYRAQMWLAQLRGEPVRSVEQPTGVRRRTGVSPGQDNSGGPVFRPSPGPSPSRSSVDRGSEPIAGNRPVPPAPAPVQPQPAPAPVRETPQAYNGPMSGTLECTGAPVPQNAEYVFRNLPPLALKLDYDQKVWDARLVSGGNQGQRLILKNKSSGPQKRCSVHWSIVP